MEHERAAMMIMIMTMTIFVRVIEEYKKVGTGLSDHNMDGRV